VAKLPDELICPLECLGCDGGDLDLLKRLGLCNELREAFTPFRRTA